MTKRRERRVDVRDWARKQRAEGREESNGRNI
jgi:hypothetical protein